MAIFIGEVFVQKYSGCWMISAIPDSKYFGEVVVGQFFRLNNQGALTNPFDIAHEYVNNPPGRSLSDLINEISEALERL